MISKERCTPDRCCGNTETCKGICLGNQPDMYQPGRWKSAEEIEISKFRQILIWPLALHRDTLSKLKDGSIRPQVDQIIDALKRDDEWDAVGNLRNHIAPENRNHSTDIEKFDDPLSKRNYSDKEKSEIFAEYVYFHDFVQCNIFNQNTIGDDKSINLFRRKGNLKLEAQLQKFSEEKKFNLAIDRINLYVFATGAVVLTMEVSATDNLELEVKITPNPPKEKGEKKTEPTAQISDPIKRAMTLADVQDFCDYFRRTYPPFFGSDGYDQEKTIEKFSARRVPTKVKIQTLDSNFDIVSRIKNPTACMNPHDAKASIDQYDAPPVLDHWRALIAPLKIVGTPEGKTAFERKKSKDIYFRQVVDERLPTMSFIALKETDFSTSGYNAAAQKAVLSIKRGDWIRLCYADQSGSDILPYSAHILKDFEKDCCYDRYFPHPSTTDGTSRMLFAGYHFAMVGSGDFFKDDMEHHFRRHYFQMGLAVHMEVSSLLATSSRITEAVKTLNAYGKSDYRAFQTNMQSIESDFLQYVHLFHFTGMSNQLQPNEMLKLWQDRLGVRQLYEDVKNELETANQFLFATDQAKQAEGAASLNIIATLGVVLGLAFSFMGMNIFFNGPDGESFSGFYNPLQWKIFGFTLSTFSLAGLAALFIVNWPKLEKTNLRVALLLAMLFSVGLFFFFCPSAIPALLKGL